MDAAYLDIRRRLGDGYAHLVTRTAQQMKSRLPNTLTWEELVGPGGMGLLQAIDRFDRTQGTAFASYGAQRVRGAILDYLREQDYVPRLCRAAARQQRAWEEARTVAGQPTHDELLPTELLAQRHQAQIRVQRSIHTPVVAGETRTLTLADELDELRVSDATPLEREEFWQQMLRGCSQVERMIVLLYFRDDWTMKQIGRELGYSESRVSQLISAVLARLKARDDRLTCVGWLPTRN